MNKKRAAAITGRMRCLLISILMTIVFCSAVLGRTLLKVHAGEETAPALNPYYTSIRLKEGDSLWKIAVTYAEGSGYTVHEYVEELKRMNGLTGEEIHSGQYLTIVYFAE